ncbi:hypothetical protein BOTBODRAFT_47418 [Botryobasidium botryosum FD-172 SS1]|uniref:Helicase C-terminal domain-containing protein n=1 Tax=Botryobasidium botryosum (strain FD-172 SS1) TaxID=930990 RepID=A0A067M266_BOTB1|nr:hypothetical protein BOTBODRAFT_47418 [Botryobasidium botryosum FD-172 SS1]
MTAPNAFPLIPTPPAPTPVEHEIKYTRSDPGGLRNHKPTYANCLLAADEDGSNFPWSSLAFQLVTGLSEQHFLDPEYLDRRERLPLPPHAIDDIREWIGKVKSDMSYLRCSRLSDFPEYNEWKDVCIAHFRSKGNLDDQVMAVLGEYEASYYDIRPRFRHLSPQEFAKAMRPRDHVGAVVAPLVDLLFGEDGYIPGTEHIRPCIRQVIVDLHYYIFKRQESVCNRRLGAIRKIRDSLLRAEECLFKYKTYSNFKRCRGYLLRWQTSLHADRDSGNAEFLEASQKIWGFVQETAPGLVGDGDSTLWTEAQLADARAAMESIASFDPDTEPAQIDLAGDEDQLGLFGDAEDLGIDEKIQGMDKPKLYMSLGIDSAGFIPGWRLVERIDGTTDDVTAIARKNKLEAYMAEIEAEVDVLDQAAILGPYTGLREPYPEEVLQTRLTAAHRLVHPRLHQLQAVAALVRRSFFAAGTPLGVARGTRSTLLADEVGLGKTAVVILYISLLRMYSFLLETNASLPPWIRETPVFGRLPEQGPVHLPSIIIVNKNLVPQWHTEHNRFVAEGQCDVFVYDVPDRDRAAWWAAPNGVWKTSKASRGSRLIIASLTAVKRDFNAYFMRSSDKFYPPIAHAAAVGSSNSPRSLYDLEFAIAAIDELHQLRKMGKEARAAMAIADRSHSTIGMTATPIFTSSVDLAHEAAVLQLPAFVYELAKDEVKTVTRMIRAARKVHRGASDEAALLARLTRDRARGSSLGEGLGNEALEDGGANINVSRTFLYHEEAVRHLRRRIIPHTIRRTAKSLDRYGLLLVPIFPLTRCVQLVNLTKTEDSVLSDIASIVITQQGYERKFVNKSFFTDYRMCLIHCGQPVPLMEQWQELTLERYRGSPSSKMDAVIAILNHHVGHYAHQDPFKMDLRNRIRTCLRWDQVTGERLPSPSQEELWARVQASAQGTPDSAPLDAVVGYTRPTKIVVYVHHTSCVSLLAKVLALHGFPCMTFTGETPPSKREGLLRDFNQQRAHVSDDGQPSWVLIISSIGSTGLNVPRACIMVYMEQVWSAAEERQINGRLCRTGQTEHVFVYTPLAVRTTDVIMSSMALAKDQMLRAFACPKGLASVLQGDGVDTEDEEEATARVESLDARESWDVMQRQGKGKSKGGRSKRKVPEPGGSAASAGARPGPAPSKRKATSPPPELPSPAKTPASSKKQAAGSGNGNGGNGNGGNGNGGNGNGGNGNGGGGNQTPTYANAYLVIESHSLNYLWGNETFQGLARLTLLNFLDPAYRSRSGPLSQERTDGIRAWYSQSRNNSLVLKSTALGHNPGYKHFMLTLTAHFRHTVDPAILALMQEWTSTPATVRHATGGHRGQKMTASVYFHALQSDLAYLLLGDSAVAYPGSPHIFPVVRAALQAIHFRIWERLMKQEITCLKRINKELEKLPALMIKFEDASDPISFRAATRCVAALTAAHDALALDLPPSVDEHRSSLGAYIDAKVIKAKEPAFRDPLWTEGEVHVAQEAWLEAFAESDETFEVPPSNGELSFADGDLGMDVFGSWDKPRLYTWLGIGSTGSIPYWKNVVREDGEPDELGITQLSPTQLAQWLDTHLLDVPIRDDPRGDHRSLRSYYPEEELSLRLPQGYRLCRARTHQLQAVAALISRTWFAEDVAREARKTLATLIANDVGLGKTALVILFISLTRDYLDRIPKGLPRPPCIGTPYRRALVPGPADPSLLPAETPVFGNYFKPILFEGPFLIVLNGTLAAQFAAEIKAFTSDGSFDVIVYNQPAAERAGWWQSPRCPLKVARTAPGNRIVLTTSNALKREYGAVFTSQPKDKFAIGKRKGVAGVHGTPLSLFDVAWAAVAVDECHQFRNFGPDARGVLHLGLTAQVVLGMTATPLLTSTMDLVHQAAMLQLPGFRSLDGCTEAAQQAKDVRSVIARARSENPGQSEMDAFMQAVANPGASVPAAASQTFLHNAAALERVSALIRPHTIRRTAASTDTFGLPLVPRLPKWIVPCKLRLSTLEDEVLSAETTRVMNMHGSPGRVYNKTSFFTPYRTALLHCGKPQAIVTRGSDVTLEEYVASPSTKINAVIRIVQHYVGAYRDKDPATMTIFERLRTNIEWDENGDERPLPTQEALWAMYGAHVAEKRGELEVVPTAPAESRRRPLIGHAQSIKVLIFVNFTSYVELISKILHLMGIPCSTLTGKIPAAKRARLLKEFNADGPHPSDRNEPSYVMVLSSVGATGLNVARASVLVPMDVQWGAADQRQLHGRLCRAGQRGDIIIHPLLAENSTDMIMSRLAVGKDQMLQGFASAKALQALLNGDTLALEEDDDDSQPLALAEPRHGESGGHAQVASARGTGKKKAAATMAPEPRPQEEAPIATTPPSPLAVEPQGAQVTKEKKKKAPQGKGKKNAAPLTSEPASHNQEVTPAIATPPTGLVKDVDAGEAAPVSEPGSLAAAPAKVTTSAIVTQPAPPPEQAAPTAAAPSVVAASPAFTPAAASSPTAPASPARALPSPAPLSPAGLSGFASDDLSFVDSSIPGELPCGPAERRTAHAEELPWAHGDYTAMDIDAFDVVEDSLATTPYDEAPPSAQPRRPSPASPSSPSEGAVTPSSPKPTIYVHGTPEPSSGAFPGCDGAQPASPDCPHDFAPQASSMPANKGKQRALSIEGFSDHETPAALPSADGPRTFPSKQRTLDQQWTPRLPAAGRPRPRPPVRGPGYQSLTGDEFHLRRRPAAPGPASSSARAPSQASGSKTSGGPGRDNTSKRAGSSANAVYTAVIDGGGESSDSLEVIGSTGGAAPPPQRAGGDEKRPRAPLGHGGSPPAKTARAVGGDSNDPQLSRFAPAARSHQKAGQAVKSMMESVHPYKAGRQRR